MHGNKNMIAALNEALKEELTAINQYFVHAELCENWKYERLAKYIKKQSIDEMKHAERLIERILFLDGTPSMQPIGVNIGAYVKQQLENDLKLEINAVAMYNRFVQPQGCRRQRLSRVVRQVARRRGRSRGLVGSATPPDQRNRSRAVLVPAGARR